MTIINVPYIILQQGETKNLLEDRKKTPEIFEGCDDEILFEYIKKYKNYYKVKFPKFPEIGIDIDGLCKWADENNYISLATDEEKQFIKWDGTRKHLFDKGKNAVPRVFLKKRLRKWAESKQVKYSKTGLLTEDSPIVPNLSLFYKKIEDGPDKYEWIFPCEIENSEAYYYTRNFMVDPKTYKSIEPIMI